ncbi:MAG: hypothetical protein M3280_12250 [Actinomycetota bacterium]|nr:hypothetical protein [Actinomycetota bacterium]
MYVGNQPLYADRRPESVVERLHKWVEVIRSHKDEAFYLLQPCRLEGRIGVYAREIFNRSSYIRKLNRSGMEFSGENHVRLTGRGTFESAAWGEFKPSFIIWLDELDDPRQVVVKSQALSSALLGPYRIGQMPAAELKSLIDATRTAPMVSAGEPTAVVEHLRSAIL